MNIKEAKEQIKNTVTAYLTKNQSGRYMIPPQKQRPVFLMGPPGIGKTAIMEQIASELGIGLLSYSMTHHTRQSALGLPIIKQVEFDGVEYDISEYTMSEIIASVHKMIARSGIRHGILFLDEINCVSETLTPIMLQFLQYKVFGMHSVPEGWIVVTAGNPPEYNRSVREFDIATWDRLKRIDVEPDLDAWKEFAYLSGIHPSVMTYLELKPNNFYKVETTVDGKSFITARGWDDLSQMIKLYEMHNIAIDSRLTAQYIQNRQIAQDFATYYDLYVKYRSKYQIGDILDGKADSLLKSRASSAKFDERYAMLGMLLDAVMSEMKQAMFTDDLLVKLLGLLKEYKKVSMEPGDQVQKLAVIRRGAEKELDSRVQSRSLSEDDRELYTKLLDILYKDILIAKAAPGREFAAVKADFDSRVKEYDDYVRRTSERAGNMFRFVKEVFREGQELIILVTELTANPVSARYLGRYRIDEYLSTADELVFHKRNVEILQEITELKLDE
ncbi:MAG: AAA family ATPase [Ruminococcus sp.]|nr:AAA family ATPase [Ruminococcus sp.]